MVPRDPNLNEVEFQFSAQMHFTWLSGDDVNQSLAHNLDRVTWAMKEQTPVKAHGMGGRSASFGVIYGNTFDHHAVVFEYANGVRAYAYCRTQNNCYGSGESIILGSKGRAYMYGGRIEGETNRIVDLKQPSLAVLAPRDIQDQLRPVGDNRMADEEGLALVVAQHGVGRGLLDGQGPGLDVFALALEPGGPAVVHPSDRAAEITRQGGQAVHAPTETAFRSGCQR